METKYITIERLPVVTVNIVPFLYQFPYFKVYNVIVFVIHGNNCQLVHFLKSENGRWG